MQNKIKTLGGFIKVFKMSQITDKLSIFLRSLKVIKIDFYTQKIFFI